MNNMHSGQYIVTSKTTTSGGSFAIEVIDIKDNVKIVNTPGPLPFRNKEERLQDLDPREKAAILDSFIK